MNSKSILIDTSIWIDHFRNDNKHLKGLLINSYPILCHEYIIGELACGNIKNRDGILKLLSSLPKAPIVSFNEYLYFIEKQKLYGLGVGFVDIHLLASALIINAKIWTLDKRLKKIATILQINYDT